MPFPVRDVTPPADLANAENGRLPDSLLVAPGFAGRPSGRLHSQTARSWLAMAAKVLELFGETLTITSTPDAYRPYGVQEWVFRDRYTRTPLPGRPSKWWDSDGDGGAERWWQEPGTAMAAVPGTSNHGWGLAVDACYWRNDAIAGITANSACFAWLLANAHLYGFSWEAQSEPWHLRLFTGDNTPAAVLAFEAPPPAHPIPPPVGTEEDPMIVVCKIGGGYWVGDPVARTRRWVDGHLGEVVTVRGAVDLLTANVVTSFAQVGTVTEAQANFYLGAPVGPTTVPPGAGI